MASRTTWKTAIAQIVRDTPFYEEFQDEIEAIAYLGIPARKELLKIARCQRSLSSNAWLRSRTSTSRDTYTCRQDQLLLDKFGFPSRDVVRKLSEFCHKDIIASAITSNLCRSAPFLNISLIEAEENKIESWEKEIAATQDLDPGPKLDYRCWFSDDVRDVHRPLSDILPPAPEHNSRIRDAFSKWKQDMSRKVFYPQCQVHKSVSRATARLYHEEIHGPDDGRFPSQVSSAMLERRYADTGVETGGPCEIRQAWKYNDLTPRTYFSQGGKAYHASKYIRGVANSLANSFTETHFQSRFSLHDIVLESLDTAFIYDYTSFTSKLAELKHFLEALADYTEDTEIFIVDSRDGVLRWSLGELIRDYNQACNVLSEFTVNRYDEGNNTLFEHKLAGFLGVYGNIVFSTTVHGLHACQLCGDNSECKCVGDDVFGKVRLDREETKEIVIERIQELGEVHPSKVRWWPYRELEEEADDDRTWPYIKRPLDRFQNRMIHDLAAFLPIFGLIYPISDGIHENGEDLLSRIKILAHQSFALVKQLRNVHPPLDSDQVTLVRQYLLTLYRATGCQEDGMLPCESKTIRGIRVSGIFLPNIVDDFIAHNPWDLLKHRFETRASVLLHVPALRPERIVKFDELLNEDGQWVESCVDQRINYLEKLGWVETSTIMEIRYMDYDEYVAFYTRFFSGDLYRLYNVRLLVDRPYWINDLSLV